MFELYIFSPGRTWNFLGTNLELKNNNCQAAHWKTSTGAENPHGNSTPLFRVFFVFQVLFSRKQSKPRLVSLLGSSIRSVEADGKHNEKDTHTSPRETAIAVGFCCLLMMMMMMMMKNKLMRTANNMMIHTIIYNEHISSF